ncbi:hypothetical protein DF052_19125 [Burkholderia glumae]|nr:hypothetical protein DF052_19125 [Burkholderia glumae]
MAVWRCGGVAVWRCGGVAVWRNGGCRPARDLAGPGQRPRSARGEPEAACRAGLLEIGAGPRAAPAVTARASPPGRRRPASRTAAARRTSPRATRCWAWPRSVRQLRAALDEANDPRNRRGRGPAPRRRPRAEPPRAIRRERDGRPPSAPA